MKKKLLVFVFLLISTITVLVSGATSFVPYVKTNGDVLKYRGTNIDVMIPEEYITQETDFRGVWVSTLVSDVAAYTTEVNFKNEMNTVLDSLEYFNINAIVYHVRTHNQALYKSELNPLAHWWANVDFDVFDPLEWLIDECHKRGIEFHAWMNPYRLGTGYYATPLPSANPASNSDYILSGNILDPGEPYVREFLVATVMELVENYNIDAVHFDDYFYVSGTEDSATRAKYNTENLSVADFRRKQVDLFIEDLHHSIKNFNLENDRLVQLGISPSGIYRNGGYVPLEDYRYDENGTLTYPLYSNSSGFSHYGDYLYSDTKKWVDEEWIDYLIPQLYWSFEQEIVNFAALSDWWNMVVKHKNVNLYSGMGLYKARSGGDSYGWRDDVNQALNQVLYTSSLEHIKGHCIFAYRDIKAAYQNPNQNILTRGFTKVKDHAWTSPVLLPEIRTYESVVLEPVTNLIFSNETGINKISFDNLEDAKFYAIYRSSEELTFSADQLVSVIGANGERVVWEDSENETYNYGVRAISKTNTLGEPASVINSSRIDLEFDTGDNKGTEVLLNDGLINENTIQVGFSRYIYPISNDLSINSLDYNWTSSNNEIASVSESGEILAHSVGMAIIRGEYKEDSTYFGDIIVNVYDKYKVVFKNIQGDILSTETILHGEDATSPVAPEIEGYLFMGWDQIFTNITSDLEINPLYEIKKFNVEFRDHFDNLLKLEVVEYNKDASYPDLDVPLGYLFAYWDGEITNIKSDLIITAVFKKVDYSIKLEANIENDLEVQINDLNGIHLEGDYGLNASLIANEENFMFWVLDNKIISFEPVFEFTITSNHGFRAYYSTDELIGVAFIDSNLSFVDFQLVSKGSSITSTKLPASKPGYEFLGWEELTEVEENKIVYASYRKIADEFLVNIINGHFKNTDESSKYIPYGNVIRIVNNDDNFSYWLLDGQVLSYNREVNISIYSDKTIEAVLDDTKAKGLSIYISNPIVDLDNYKLVYLGKFTNPFDVEIVEMGAISILGEGRDPKEEIGSSERRIFRYSPYDEFSVLFNYLNGQHLNLRFYIVTKLNNNYIYTYSDLKTFEMEDLSSDLEFILNGGGFYTYNSREEMVIDFMNDFNTYYSSDLKANEFKEETYGWNVANFFSNENYSEKWQWMRDYIIQVTEVQVPASANELKSNNDPYWRYAIDSFLNMDVRSVYPISADFRSNPAANGFWAELKVNPPTSYDIGFEFELPIPIKFGFEFSGWYLNQDFSGTSLDKIPSNASGKIALYARWTIEGVDYYEVSFKANNGSEVVVENIEHGTKVTKPTDPVKEDYHFVGWYIDEDLLELYDFDSEVVGHLTLYAKWTMELATVQLNWEYESKEEEVNAFLFDFYIWLVYKGLINEQDMTFLEFSGIEKAGTGLESKYIGNWLNYIGLEGDVFDFGGDYWVNSVNYLRLQGSSATSPYIIDNNYFFNSIEYRAKWLQYANWINETVNRHNKRFWSNNLGGAYDIARYITGINVGTSYRLDDYLGLFFMTIDYHEDSNPILPTITNLGKSLTWNTENDGTGIEILFLPTDDLVNLILYARWEDLEE